MLLRLSPGLQALAFASAAHALPLASLGPPGAVSTLPYPQISGFKPYTHYASTAYCHPKNTLSWTCGPNCDANPSFIPTASGGDGILTQFWFVGYDPALREVIVSHQGTDVDKFIPDLTDIDMFLIPLDPYFFPGVEPPVLVHNGFSATHARSASHVVAAVEAAVSDYSTRAVTVTGHSLGAAIALLDAISLPLLVPNVTVRYVGYGLPRVGNRAFADYVDSQPISVTHINNKEDPVPVLPSISLGYHHPSGEVHIQDSDEWMACAGQDNWSKQCSTGDVSFMRFDERNHDGPFDGIVMGC